MNVEELNLMLDRSLDWGCTVLEKDGYFHPFSFVMDAKGELMRTGDLSEEEKDMNPEELIAQMKAMLASGARQGIYRGCCVGVDVKVEDPRSSVMTKAIEVQVEHAEGDAYDCFLPYKVNADKSISYGTIFSSAFDGELFKK